MQKNSLLTAESFVPATSSLTELAKAAKHCQGCDLYRLATQTVFGEGPKGAQVVMVGEQPGNQEDLEGRPFVGPAGRVLDRALNDAQIDRKLVYVTNAVKHFKFEERGKRRIHKKPNVAEINACHPWLEAELNAVKPRVVVALGATAAFALAGRGVQVMRDRGKLLPHESAEALVLTIHPSSLLRMPDPDVKAREYEHFVEDLKLVRTKLLA
jgi:uracil-DNA glycosylase family protein